MSDVILNRAWSHISEHNPGHLPRFGNTVRVNHTHVRTARPEESQADTHMKSETCRKLGFKSQLR